MPFRDCRMSYGKYINNAPYKPCDTIDELAQEMVKAGIEGGFVFNSAADIAGPILGNRLLAEELSYTANKYPMLDLKGMYTLLPDCTCELPSAEELPEVMRESRMCILRMNPAAHRYMPKPHVLGGYLKMAQERKIPVMFDTSAGLKLEEADVILEGFPDLTAILSYNNVWPCDRLLYPFLKRYRNLKLDTTFLVADRVYEKAVSLFGASRLIYGSGFPVGYMGVNMLTIMHSDLTEEEKAAIASGNIIKMIKEADFT